MEVGDQCTDIPGTVRPARLRVVLLQPLNPLNVGFEPGAGVALIRRIDVRFSRKFQIGEGEVKLAHRRVQRECVDTLPGRVHEHRRRPVKNVARRGLVSAGLQQVLHVADA